jgi:hypothetical protein
MRTRTYFVLLSAVELEGLRQFVQHIGRLLDSTPLLARLAVHLAECLPKPQHAIANCRG